MAARGRPSIYTQDLADEICSRLMRGETLRQVCRSEGMPDESTVRQWAFDDYQGFYPQYTRAREIGYETMADELLEIADDGTNDYMDDVADGEAVGYKLNGEHIQRSRLRTDTRKWLLSKALPKVYGDKLDLKQEGNLTITLAKDVDDL